MTTKHICVMEAKSYGGSYGVGDTKEEATKKARKELGQKPGKVHFYEIDVPEGSRLVIRGDVGVHWWTEPVVPAERPARLDRDFPDAIDHYKD